MQMFSGVVWPSLRFGANLGSVSLRLKSGLMSNFCFRRRINMSSAPSGQKSRTKRACSLEWDEAVADDARMRRLRWIPRKEPKRGR